MSGNRSRGRPVGSGFQDDLLLATIAKMKLDEPTLKVAAAVRRISSKQRPRGNSSNAITRRIQAKWQAQGEKLLSEARSERQRLLQKQASENANRVTLSDIQMLFASIQQMKETVRATMAAPTFAVAMDHIQENLKAFDLFKGRLAKTDLDLAAEGAQRFQESFRAATGWHGALSQLQKRIE